jgi:hypothetical protein
MHGFNVLLVGIIRNGADKIRQSVRNIDRAFGFSQQRSWLVVESDSEDDTVNVLQQMCGEFQNFSFMSLGALRHHLPSRTQRIAHCRNHYLEAIDNDPRFQNVDYVVIVDLDGVNDALTEAAVRSCLHRNDWDACFANQTGAYYDIWALRHELWSPNDCWAQINFLTQRGINPDYALYASVVSRMIEIPPHAQWIQVRSAFGGLGIYRKEILRGLRHHGLSSSGSEVCEWVAFNETLASRGHKLFINPQLINGGYNEHSSRYRQLLGQSRHSSVAA